MPYVRDPDRMTRGVGAVAAIDHAQPGAARARERRLADALARKEARRSGLAFGVRGGVAGLEALGRINLTNVGASGFKRDQLMAPDPGGYGAGGSGGVVGPAPTVHGGGVGVRPPTRPPAMPPKPIGPRRPPNALVPSAGGGHVLVPGTIPSGASAGGGHVYTGGGGGGGGASAGGGQSSPVDDPVAIDDPATTPATATPPRRNLLILTAIVAGVILYSRSTEGRQS